MRLFLLLFCGGLTLGASAQNLNLGLGMHTALKDQKGKLKNAYGFTTGYEHRLGHSPFYALVDFSSSLYDYKHMEQDLPSPDGHITKQQVDYTSMVTLLTPGIGWALVRGKAVNPYVAVEGGYIKHRTLMTLYDANDPDGCRPEDKKNIVRDYTAVAVASSGVKVRMVPCPHMSFIDVGVNYITGGTSKYLRMSENKASTPPQAEPYLVKFEHVATGEVHTHALGDLYTTKTRQLQFYIRACWDLKK